MHKSTSTQHACIHIARRAANDREASPSIDAAGLRGGLLRFLRAVYAHVCGPMSVCPCPCPSLPRIRRTNPITNPIDHRPITTAATVAATPSQCDGASTRATSGTPATATATGHRHRRPERAGRQRPTQPVMGPKLPPLRTKRPPSSVSRCHFGRVSTGGGGGGAYAFSAS